MSIAEFVKERRKKLGMTQVMLPGVFAGFRNFALTLPDGWQGDLPDKDGNWYGVTDVTLTGGIPLAVKNVTSQQRYPWNGLVDIACDLTGEGEVTLSATVLTNGVKFIWNAAADLPVGFKAGGIQLKVTAEK